MCWKSIGAGFPGKITGRVYPKTAKYVLTVSILGLHYPLCSILLLPEQLYPTIED